MQCFCWGCSQWCFLNFSCLSPGFHEGTGTVWKGWNRRSSKELRQIHPEAWCGSLCHFHIDWCKRWIKVKATAAMLFLLWSLVFLWRHHLISQDHYGMLSHGMLSFSNETCMLYYSNNWDLFLKFIIYWLWGHVWNPITSSRVSSAPYLLHFV